MSEINYTITGREATLNWVLPTSEGDLSNMSFSSRLNSLEFDGARASRSSWHRCVYIKVQVPDEYSKMGCPYIYIIKKHRGKPVPWLPSFEDLFAKDWVVFK